MRLGKYQQVFLFLVRAVSHEFHPFGRAEQKLVVGSQVRPLGILKILQA